MLLEQAVQASTFHQAQASYTVSIENQPVTFTAYVQQKDDGTYELYITYMAEEKAPPSAEPQENFASPQQVEKSMQRLSGSQSLVWEPTTSMNPGVLEIDAWKWDEWYQQWR